MNLLGEATEAHLKQLFSVALQSTGISPKKNGKYKMTVELTNEGLMVSSQKGFPGLEKVNTSLQDMRVFFNTLNKVFEVTDSYTYTIEVKWQNGNYSFQEIKAEFK